VRWALAVAPARAGARTTRAAADVLPPARKA
jgi:hypothetical protein